VFTRTFRVTRFAAVALLAPSDSIKPQEPVPQRNYPGVYVKEVSSGVHVIAGVNTSITAFVGRAAAGATNDPVTLTSFAEFERRFGGLDLASPMSYAVRDYFVNGGRVALVVRVQSKTGNTDIDDDDVIGNPQQQTGIYALNRADLFNLLCIPPRIRDTGTLPSTYTPTSASVYQAALEVCVSRRAMLIVDPDPDWASQTSLAIDRAIAGRRDLGLHGQAARNAALYFPCVRHRDPLRGGQVDTFVPSGAIAGVMARTDAQRGVWNAPAGLEATLTGVHDLQFSVNDSQNGQLNPLGINCLRPMGAKSHVLWGARTLAGADGSGDEYKYVSVRRLALFLEESIDRGTRWAVFEPNDEPLWAQLRLHIEAFMRGLFRQGAFQGTTPREAYFVKCDRSTMTEHDTTHGIVNIVVGFAPLKPAEFVLLTIRQRAGQTSD